MKASWWIGAVTLFVLCQLTANTVEAGVTGVNMLSLQNIFDVSGADFSNPIAGIISVFTVPWTWVTNLLNILLFNYPSIFRGDYIWFRTLFLLPVSLAMVITTWLAVVRGTSST